MLRSLKVFLVNASPGVFLSQSSFLPFKIVLSYISYSCLRLDITLSGTFLIQNTSEGVCIYICTPVDKFVEIYINANLCLSELLSPLKFGCETKFVDVSF